MHVNNEVDNFVDAHQVVVLNWMIYAASGKKSFSLFLNERIARRSYRESFKLFGNNTLYHAFN